MKPGQKFMFVSVSDKSLSFDPRRLFLSKSLIKKLPGLAACLTALSLALTPLCSEAADAAAAQTQGSASGYLYLESEKGRISLPTLSELDAQTEAVNADSSLDDAGRRAKLEQISEAKTALDKIEKNQAYLEFLQNNEKQPEQLVNEAADSYSKAQQDFAGPLDISDKDSDALKLLLEESKQNASGAQQELSQANAFYTRLQTLPESAQNLINDNKQQQDALNAKIQAASDLNAPETRIDALKLYGLKLDNQVLQLELAHQTHLFDRADYLVKTATLKNDYYLNLVRLIETRQNELRADTLKDAALTGGVDVSSIPELKSELDVNSAIAAYLNKQLDNKMQLTDDYHKLENAMVTATQIEKNIDSEIEGLGQSLILSRMLNRRQSELPQISLKYDTEELISELNMMNYELRQRREEMFDLNAYVDEKIAVKPALADYREVYLEILDKRKQLLNDTQQEITSCLNQAINVRIKYQEFTALKGKIESVITENLLWLRSNYGLGSDLFKYLVPAFSYELKSVGTHFESPNFWSNTLKTVVWLLLPSLLLAALVVFFKNPLNHLQNKLNSRLDRIDDSIFLTLKACIGKFILSIPAVAVWLVIGAVFICSAVDDALMQVEVCGILGLHIMVFTFMTEILKPNSLCQRHFCMSPGVLAKNRALLRKVWFAIIPALIVANIAELSPEGIFYDVIGYFIMLGSSLALCVIAALWLRERLKSNDSMTLVAWVTVLCCLGAALTMVLMLATGYYYTMVKLINRVAFTAYLGLLYLLLRELIKRALYVLKTRAQRKILTEAFAAQSSGHERQGSAALTYAQGSSASDSSKADGLTLDQKLGRLSSVHQRAFKLINGGLLLLTLCFIYLQWRDLMGALIYLDKIVLWNHVSVVDGREVVTPALTLGNLLMAAVFVIIAAILNRNLPAILERIVASGRSLQTKSTGYTVKIISSYLILTLGVIFAGGALGISWDDLQWLVAALSVGLGFGLQEIFANFVSGIIILFERQIRVGDIITLSGLSGTVQKIRIRSTTVVDFENKEVMIPNKQFITSALTNWSLSNAITKLSFDVGVAYDADVDRAKEILMDIVQRCPYINRTQAPLVYVESLMDSSVNLRVECLVSEIGKRKLTTDYLSATTLKEFADAGIEIPFNQLDVTVKNLKDAVK